MFTASLRDLYMAADNLISVTSVRNCKPSWQRVRVAFRLQVVLTLPTATCRNTFCFVTTDYSKVGNEQFLKLTRFKRSLFASEAGRRALESFSRDVRLDCGFIRP